MHKIHTKEFTLDDFSHEHLFTYDDTEVGSPISVGCLRNTVDTLNYYRVKYIDTKDKSYWWQMIQLLPTSYNQKRTIQLNYEVLTNIYHSRKDHKLDEWHAFCDMIKELPNSWIITNSKDEEK